MRIYSKVAILALIYLLENASNGYAQRTDSVRVLFKSGRRVTLALKDVRKITFDSATARVESGTDQRSVLSQGVFPNPSAHTQSFSFQAKEEGTYTITISNSNGVLVRHLGPARCLSGENTLLWDMRDDSGQLLPSGEYLYAIRVGETSGIGKVIITR